MGISAGSREVPVRNACDRRHPYCMIIMMIIIIIIIIIMSVSGGDQRWFKRSTGKKWL